jgi:hypothetical protein
MKQSNGMGLDTLQQAVLVKADDCEGMDEIGSSHSHHSNYVCNLHYTLMWCTDNTCTEYPLLPCFEGSFAHNLKIEIALRFQHCWELKAAKYYSRQAHFASAAQ